MKHALLLLITLLLPLLAVAQGDDCHPHFSGSDKSDFDKGIEAYNNKRYQQCLSLMRKVSQRNRTAADPYFYMGISAVKCGERPAAIRSHLTKLFKYCPDYPNALAYFYMGVVEYTYKNYEDAVVQLNRYFDIANQQPNPAYDVVYEEASTYLYWSEFLAQAQQNQVPFYPTILRGPSSRYNEHRPFITPDGKELYYLREIPDPRKKTFYSREQDNMVLRLFVSRWKDTAYTAGEQLPLPFNRDDVEMSNITSTADGNLIFLSVMSSDNGHPNCDIYYCRRTNGKWGALQNAGRNVNGERTWDSQPSITPDGQYLYFVSNRSGGQGGDDIWRCRRLANGDWSRAENLGPAVNTPGNEKSPFIHADGKTLYFASNGWQGFGGYDMYFIDLTDTYLQRPTNLGLPINSEENDISFNVSTDGKQGYFAGKSTEWAGIGGNDIFSFELYPAAQPEEMDIVSGTLLTSSGKKAQGTIAVLRQKSDADLYAVDSSDGRFAIALSARNSNTVIVNIENCMPRVAIGNAHQLRRDLNAADFTAQPAVLWGRYTLPLASNVAKSIATNRQMATILDAYADYLLQHPRMHIRIEATTIDEAKTIYDYLLSRQLRAERFEYKPNQSLAKPQLVITQM